MKEDIQAMLFAINEKNYSKAAKILRQIMEAKLESKVSQIKKDLNESKMGEYYEMVEELIDAKSEKEVQKILKTYDFIIGTIELNSKDLKSILNSSDDEEISEILNKYIK